MDKPNPVAVELSGRLQVSHIQDNALDSVHFCVVDFERAFGLFTNGMIQVKV